MHAFVKTMLGDKRLVLEKMFICAEDTFSSINYYGGEIHRLYIWYFPKGLLVEPFEMN